MDENNLIQHDGSNSQGSVLPFAAEILNDTPAIVVDSFLTATNNVPSGPFSDTDSEEGQ